MDKIKDFAVNSARWFSLEDFEGEVWKDVVGYEGLYQVSNLGRVKSLERNVEKSNKKSMFVCSRILRPFTNKKYQYSTLSKNGKESNNKIHRLVAYAFIKNPNNYTQINHKDENTLNNCVDNLEWCTNSYNRYYGTINARIRKTKRIKSGISIIRLNIDGSFSKRYECGIDIKGDGFDRRAVYRCCKDNGRIHKNYKWKFEKDVTWKEKN